MFLLYKNQTRCDLYMSATCIQTTCAIFSALIIDVSFVHKSLKLRISSIRMVRRSGEGRVACFEPKL